MNNNRRAELVRITQANITRQPEEERKAWLTKQLEDMRYILTIAEDYYRMNYPKK